MSRPGESEEQKLITCNRCGKLTYEGFGSCQYCGALFSGKSGSGVDPKTGVPEQPELPAWLESLRDGERPAESSSEQFNYARMVLLIKMLCRAGCFRRAQSISLQNSVPYEVGFAASTEY